MPEFSRNLSCCTMLWNVVFWDNMLIFVNVSKVKIHLPSSWLEDFFIRLDEERNRDWGGDGKVFFQFWCLGFLSTSFPSARLPCSILGALSPSQHLNNCPGWGFLELRPSLVAKRSPHLLQLNLHCVGRTSREAQRFITSGADRWKLRGFRRLVWNLLNLLYGLY